MLKIFLLIVCTAGFSEALNLFDLGKQFNATEYVDAVLDRYKKLVVSLNLDPYNTTTLALKIGNQSVGLRNGQIKGLSNVHRLGDVYVNTTIFNTKVRSAFAIYNVSKDQDVEIMLGNISYPNGHVHLDCDNITVYQVYKIEHLTRTATLDEFKLSIGNCNYNVSGLGERAQNGSDTITNLFTENKEDILTLFNFVFPILINIALASASAAIGG